MNNARLLYSSVVYCIKNMPNVRKSLEKSNMYSRCFCSSNRKLNITVKPINFKISKKKKTLPLKFSFRCRVRAMKHKMTCVLLLSNTSHRVNARYPNKLDSHWLLRKSLVKIDNGIFVDDCDELGRNS